MQWLKVCKLFPFFPEQLKLELKKVPWDLKLQRKVKVKSLIWDFIPYEVIL